MPAFHAIMVVRDEGDIIAQMLDHLLSWCDSLTVLDTGSLDDTWAILQDRAGRESRLRLLGSEPLRFDEGIRAWVFERARPHFRPGDWIARVDADEFFHIPPPRFIAERVERFESRICTCMYDFLLSRRDLKAWQEGRETVADRDRPIEERRRYFRFDEFPEQRFFRYRRGMSWSPRAYHPTHGGMLARQRIPVRHYRARDPLQVQVRCAIREPTAEAAPLTAWHWQIPDWRAFVFAEADPTMHHWAPGTELPVHPATELKVPPMRRLGQHALYRSGAVHVSDWLRPRRAVAKPPAMDPVVQERVAGNLGRVRERPYLIDEPEQVQERRARGAAIPMPPP